MKRDTKIMLFFGGLTVAYYYQDQLKNCIAKWRGGWEVTKSGPLVAPTLTDKGSLAMRDVRNREFRAYLAGVQRSHQLHPRSV